MMQINDITEKIIGCAFRVSNTLGTGFLEKVYENALVHELRKNGLLVQQQVAVKVQYDQVIVGDYIADILVAEKVLVELKAVRTLADSHVAQCLNYLAATQLSVCLLMNFGTSKIQIKRLVK